MASATQLELELQATEAHLPLHDQYTRTRPAALLCEKLPGCILIPIGSVFTQQNGTDLDK